MEKRLDLYYFLGPMPLFAFCNVTRHSGTAQGMKMKAQPTKWLGSSA